MGITGLLPMITPHIKKTPLSAFKNKRIGIDGHAWLYKCCTVVGLSIYQKKDEKIYLKLLQKKIDPLLKNKIIPIFVFDGKPTKAKDSTSLKRLEKKQEAIEKLEKAIKRNDKKEMYNLARQCVSISKEMMDDVFEFLDKQNIEYVQSPYETDAELFYLQKINYIDGIITEDSDLIVYGCDNILYKYDNSSALLYKKGNLSNYLPKFFAERILEISVLSGCDYLKSIKGVGLKVAYTLLKQHENVENVVEFLKIKKEVPENYLEEFKKAIMTFHHQVIYDPIKNKRLHLCGSDVDMNQEHLGSLNPDEESSEDKTINLNEIEVKTDEKSPYFK